MLTAKGAEEDKVRRSAAGADDYITKPFSAQELLARVEAVLRRARPPEEVSASSETIEVGDLRIDARQKQVTVAGRELRLSPTEYRLLSCLAANAGVVLSRDELLSQVWGDAYRGEHEILRVTLWRLRQKLADDPSIPPTSSPVPAMATCSPGRRSSGTGRNGSVTAPLWSRNGHRR